MQQLLVDELTGDRVILAPARALRPDTFRAPSEQLSPTDSSCPFCAGNEHETPPELDRCGPGEPDSPGWTLRVVPNKYPIVGDGVPGAHEVVIFCPAHDVDLGALPDDAAADVLLALRDRARFHLAHEHVYAQAFVNHGKAAGASIAHPHAQLVALDLVPARARVRLEHFTAAAFARDQEHLVTDGDVLVWCPRAAPMPYTLRLAPVSGGARFDQATDDEARATGIALHRTIAKLRTIIGGAAYNVMVETAPRDHDGPFQWWIDVVPRLTSIAGFELGTGTWVNIVPPADAAAALRDAE